MITPKRNGHWARTGVVSLQTVTTSSALWLAMSLGPEVGTRSAASAIASRLFAEPFHFRFAALAALQMAHGSGWTPVAPDDVSAALIRLDEAVHGNGSLLGRAQA